MRKLRSYLKNTRLWILISSSEAYQQFKNPAQFKESQEELAFYKTLLQNIPFNKDLIFDVGANLGQKSAIFTKLAKKVIAFEPGEKSYNYLQKRFAGQNIVIMNCALGSSETFLEFYESGGDGAYDSFSKKHMEMAAARRGGSRTYQLAPQKVKVDILENIIKKFGVPVYIKIDVEGYEYEVAKGLSTPVPLISFEANLPDFYEESVMIIEHLTKISSGRYRFNFAKENSFLEDTFLSHEAAKFFLQKTKLDYLEIYARLS